MIEPPSLVTATFKLLNSGIYVDTGSSRLIIPSSTKSIVIEMVTILLIDHILNQVFSSMI